MTPTKTDETKKAGLTPIEQSRRIETIIETCNRERTSVKTLDLDTSNPQSTPDPDRPSIDASALDVGLLPT
jgi:hypothetical protein